MAIIEVYTKAIKVKYKTALLSKATLFYLITGVISIVVPYVLAYESGGFWKKWDVVHEQPKITTRGEFLIMLMTNNPNTPIVCSTFKFYKKNLNNLNSCALFLLREIDNNNDKIPDKLDFSLKINLRSNKVASLFVFLPINYNLNNECPLKMQSAIIFQHYFHDPSVSDLHLMADLEFRQSSMAYCDKRFLNNAYDSPLINDDFQNGEYFEFENILERYLNRNFSTHLANVYVNLKQEYNYKDEFNLKLSIRFPENKIYFQPGFWQIIKVAWIHYLSIFIAIVWLMEKLKSYIFENRLFLFYEDSPLIKNAFSPN